MANVIGVRFKSAGKLYYFDPGQLWPTAGDAVIVETARGVEYGEAITGVREVDDDKIVAPLKTVIRIATVQDKQHTAENEEKQEAAFALCQKKIEEHGLEMKLVSVQYTFDNAKILFYFTANGRIDFRALVKDLASTFKSRIELRQIGVRDEAKLLGGLGPCGRPICCGSFLGDFQPVSIKMAKEQNISLNPTKISGVCGRLMCCLKFEQDQYESIRKSLPKIGKDVITPDGRGTVTSLDILKELVLVRVSKGDSYEYKQYPASDIQRLSPAPIPKPEPIKEAPAQPAPAAQIKQVQDAVKPAAEEKKAAKRPFFVPIKYDENGEPIIESGDDAKREEPEVISSEVDEDVVDIIADIDGLELYSGDDDTI